MSGGEFVNVIRKLIEWSALGIEILAVAVIVLGVVAVAIKRAIVRHPFSLGRAGEFASYRQELGPSLLLGLDFLVAGDVVKTVALEPALGNVAALGLLVLVRTFLSWAVILEVEGHWPWQPQASRPMGETEAGQAAETIPLIPAATASAQAAKMPAKT